MTNPSFDPYLELLLASRERSLTSYAAMLAEFASWVNTEVDPQAAYTDRYAPPILETYDRNGTVVNRIVLNSRYEAQHAEVYRRGIIGLCYSEGAPHLLTFTMGYLLAQADISLHCPVTLTGAVAYVLAYYAPQDVRTRYLHEVVRTDGLAKTGGTWATEQHGGSDVGATTTRAIRAGDHCKLHGLKWFTSNANSGLALATARPDGAPANSEGLGLYLVPSHLEDGSPNFYRIRRLKEKLGTKGLPTGEIELEGAFAIEVAPPPHGLKMMMEALEYSRIHNAVGAAGMQRRALREALEWSKSRRAFDRTLVEFPMVQDQLLSMRVQYEATTLLAFEAAIAFDETLTNPERRTWLRITTALAKYLSAEGAINATRSALELLGGNGYTREFATERLLRDAQVLTVWEGPANIQALELLRMLCAKYAGARRYEERMRIILDSMPEHLSELRAKLADRLSGDLNAIQDASSTAAKAQRYARKLLHRLSESLAFALMCELATKAEGAAASHCALTALRYIQEIEPPAIGEESEQLHSAALELLEEAQLTQARSSSATALHL